MNRSTDSVYEPRIPEARGSRLIGALIGVFCHCLFKAVQSSASGLVGWSFLGLLRRLVLLLLLLAFFAAM